MLRTALTCPSRVEILEEPLDTVPLRELADATVSEGALGGRPSMR